MMSLVNAVMIPRSTLSNVPMAEESAIGSTPNLEDGNASTNVSINDNDNDYFSDGVSDEHQVKKNLGTKREIQFQEEALHLEKRNIKLTEEMMNKSQADEDYKFLTSILPSIEMDYNERLELRIKFLVIVTKRIQISKNHSQHFISVPTSSNSPCLPSPSSRAASLD
jgi:hypothetical protein